MITVSGTLKTGSGSVAPSGSFVRFWCRGCRGNQPFVSGTALVAPNGGNTYYVDLASDATTGAVSGSLYSTTEISVGGSTGVIYYGMQVNASGVLGPEVPVDASANININAPTLLSVLPVSVTPTGDTTYIRLDGTNSTLDAGLTLNSNKIANTASGVFTNTQTNEVATSILNSLDIGAQFRNMQGGNNTTDALAGAVAVPNTATVWQANAVAGYATSNSTTTSVTPLYGQVLSSVNGTKIWGGNVVCADNGTNIAKGVGFEIDCNFSGAPTGQVMALQLTGILNWSALPTNSWWLNIGASSGGAFPKMSTGIQIADGAANNGLIVGSITATANSNSQTIILVDRDGSNVARNSTIQNQGGTLAIAASNNSIVLNSNTTMGFGTSFTGPGTAAAAGDIRLKNAGALAWRNAANSADLPLTADANSFLTYNGQKVAQETASPIDLTTQGAAISATTAYAVPALGAGLYRISYVASITRAGSVSSTLGGANGFQVVYTDANDSVAKTSPVGPTSAANTTATMVSGTIIVNAKLSTNIQYQFGYTDGGGTTMQYNLHVRVEAL